mmetsp:Transcript_3025/g.4863  ORF Transcript_3025/g.4863 Transcript_3025/m.4863 type:complete len:449 (+) Transcript_3025:28-1374(+)
MRPSESALSSICSMAFSQWSLLIITAALLAGAASQTPETCAHAGAPEGSSMIQTKSNSASMTDASVRSLPRVRLPPPPAQNPPPASSAEQLPPSEPRPAGVNQAQPPPASPPASPAASNQAQPPADNQASGPPPHDPAQEVLFGAQMPNELQALGESTFGSKENLRALLAKTKVMKISYAGVEMYIAMGKDDTAADILGNKERATNNGEGYGLDTMLVAGDGEEAAFEQRRSQGGGMVNMIDVGGWLGVVTIAAFKKYPNLVRAVVVEPAPTTFFYANINMWLNGVPSLTVQPSQPGVNIVRNAISDQKDVEVLMCTPMRNGKPSAWDAYAVTPGKTCNCIEGGTDKCDHVLSTPMSTIFDFFDEEDITLLKMDCEDCEQLALADVDRSYQRVRRLGIELIMTRPVSADIACSFNGGKYVRGSCQSRRNPTAQYLTGSDFCAKCSAAG